MIKPMTLTELKKELKKLDQVELIDMISTLYKSNEKAKELINTRFIGEKYQQDVLGSYKKKMHDEFFPKNMRKMPSLKAAKSLITEVKKIGSFEMVLDLMLYMSNVEPNLQMNMGIWMARFITAFVAYLTKLLIS